MPSPLSIAFILTFITFIFAYFLSEDTTDVTNTERFINIFSYWEKGIWNSGLLVFAMQMMLMLVLGHILALTSFMSKLTEGLCKLATNNAKAAVLVCFSTLLVSFFNWGLGLIFGAIISRKVGERALKHNMPLNYPLIGAAGYSGLLFWHGGISGSSLTKVAEVGHLKSLMSDIVSPDVLLLLPESISFSETVFSPLNVVASIAILTVLPLLMYYFGKTEKYTSLAFLKSKELQSSEPKQRLIGAEKIDHSRFLPKLIGGGILLYILFSTANNSDLKSLGFITPNFINLSLLALAIFFHRSISDFLQATDKAIGGASGILIQFPLYFGIMGIMKGSGMIQLLSDFFVSISTANSFPIFTLFSAGIVNIFVPSGGGQWAIQGPIIVQAAMDLNISLPKCILALAYGDQLTNMLQPFWALPLLGITKLKAKEILPYTLLLMVAGGIIYLSALLLF